MTRSCSHQYFARDHPVFGLSANVLVTNMLRINYVAVAISREVLQLTRTHTDAQARTSVLIDTHGHCLPEGDNQ